MSMMRRSRWKYYYKHFSREDCVTINRHYMAQECLINDDLHMVEPEGAEKLDNMTKDYESTNID